MHIIKARTSHIWLGDDGILRRVVHDGVVDEEADAREAIAAISQLAASAPLPVLNDMRGLRSVSRGARAVFSAPELTAWVTAAALLVESPVTRMIASFFLGFNSPPFPVALFTSEEEALSWLKTCREPAR